MYKLFLRDGVYPWDSPAKNLEGPWHIVDDLDHLRGYVAGFGIPSDVCLYGPDALAATRWMIDTCRDLGTKFPKCTGSTEILECIDEAKVKGQIHQ